MDSAGLLLLGLAIDGPMKMKHWELLFSRRFDADRRSRSRFPSREPGWTIGWLLFLNHMANLAFPPEYCGLSASAKIGESNRLAALIEICLSNAPLIHGEDILRKNSGLDGCDSDIADAENGQGVPSHGLLQPEGHAAGFLRRSYYFARNTVVHMHGEVAFMSVYGLGIQRKTGPSSTNPSSTASSGWEDDA